MNKRGLNIKTFKKYLSQEINALKIFCTMLGHNEGFVLKYSLTSCEKKKKKSDFYKRNKF